LSPKNRKGINRFVSNLSLSKKNTFAQIAMQKKKTFHVRKKFVKTIVPTSQLSMTLFQHSTITTIQQSVIVRSRVKSKQRPKSLQQLSK
jgi:hypothetical protein